jgi:hypothetical protein
MEMGVDLYKKKKNEKASLKIFYSRDSHYCQVGNESLSPFDACDLLLAGVKCCVALCDYSCIFGKKMRVHYHD